MTEPIMMRCALAFSVVLAVTAGRSPGAQQQAAQGAERGELRTRILEIAQRYATFEWTASEANVLHGEDADGVRIDTPDQGFDAKGWRFDGAVNRGMPYAWGGFSTIEEFNKGLEQGLYAGLVPVSERARSSRHALGVDCSGFVARCWELPVKQSTRSLGRLCYRLEDCAQLRAGDILNKFDSHVVLFKEWAEADRSVMRVIEAARLGVEENDYPTALLVSSGFVPMRFMPLDARWVSMEMGEAEFSTDGLSDTGRFTADADASLDTTVPDHPWQDTRAGEWARYRVSDTFDRLPPAYSMLRKAAEVREKTVHGQCLIDVRGEHLPSGSELSLQASVTDALIDFAAFETPLHRLQVARDEVAHGRYEWGDRSFRAQRRSIELQGDFIMRHKAFPLTLTIDCVASDEVPLHGVLRADMVMAIDFGDGTFKRKKGFTLDRCGAGRDARK